MVQLRQACAGLVLNMWAQMMLTFCLNVDVSPRPFRHPLTHFAHLYMLYEWVFFLHVQDIRSFTV